uniref:Uncharacterized protein n=1 Tax=Lutzomyia longipalpis TaxID=7200 RepID=A0A1B0CHK5_LUTLO
MAEVTESVEKVEENTNGAAEKDNEPSQLESSIIRQVEYYFGDTNLARDKFLQEQVAKDTAGWVDLTVLLTFKRLAALTTEPEVVCKALAKSTEMIVEVNEDRTKLRRHPDNPLPEQNEETRKEVQARTVYAKGFPVEGTTIEDLLEYFQPFEKVVNIQMRRRPEKKDGNTVHVFKGSCFVTFATLEQAKEFVEKEKVEYKETNLLRMFKADYLEKSKLEHAEEKKKKKQQHKEEDSAFTLPKGTLLHITEIGADSTVESLKEAFGKLEADVAFVEYKRGEKEAMVRLKVENTAKTVFEKLEGGKITLDGVEATARLVEGTEEEEFLAKTIKTMAERRNFKKNKGGRGNKGGKYQNNKKRSAPAGDNDEEPPAKK